MADKTFQSCLDAAYHYLSYRPRSEAELKKRLLQRGFDNDIVERTTSRLKQQNLVDDIAFAQFWKDNRLSFNPRSKKLIMSELRNKEVASEIIEQATSDINDEANAYKLGYKRMPSLAHLDYPSFSRRLSNYLSYRGFSYEVIEHTIALLWQERECHFIACRAEQ